MATKAKTKRANEMKVATKAKTKRANEVEVATKTEAIRLICHPPTRTGNCIEPADGYGKHVQLPIYASTRSNVDWGPIVLDEPSVRGQVDDPPESDMEYEVVVLGEVDEPPEPDTE